MRERELSELEIRAAFQAFLEDAPIDVQPAVLVDRLVRAHQADRHTRRWWSILVPPADRSPVLRLAWLVALVGLLLAATASALYVGGQLLRRADELTDVRQPTVTLTLAQPGQMMEVAWSPDGTHLATGSYSEESNADSPWLRHTVRVWDASSGEMVIGIQREDPLSSRTRIAYSPDGALLVVGSNVSDDVNIYDPTTGEGLPDKSESIRSASWESLEVLAYSPDGTRIAVGGYYVGPAILDATTGRIELEFPASVSDIPGYFSFVGDAAWSPDGARLATAYGAIVRVWDATSGDLLLTLAGDEAPCLTVTGYECGDYDVRDIEWSPDGTRIASMHPSQATLWNAVSGERLLTIDLRPATPLDQRPATPLAWWLEGHAAVSWSPDSTRFVTAGVDGAARIWDATSGTQVASLTGSRRDVTDVEWSPDGTRIATASYDGTATIWPVPTAANEQPTPSVSPTEDQRSLEPVGEPIVSDTALGTITWRVYNGIYVAADLDTPHGPVGLASGGPDENVIYPDGLTHPTCALPCLFWLGPDGTWAGTTVPELTSGLVPVGDDLIAYSNESAWRVSWDGSRWVLGDQLDLPPYFLAEGNTPGVQLRQVFVAAGPRGVLIVGEGVAAAPDGQHFVSVEELPGGSDARVARIGPVVATADGFIALVSPAGRYIATDEPWFDPIPWFSADGLTWEPVASSSPFGEDSEIWEVAGRDGRYVAVGNTGAEYGPAAAWASDDGRTWEPLLVPGLGGDQCPGCPTAVTANDAGWVISTEWHQSLWASADGRTWEPLTVPGISSEEVWGLLPGLSLGGDTIVVTVVGYGRLTSAVGTIEP